MFVQYLSDGLYVLIDNVFRIACVRTRALSTTNQFMFYAAKKRKQINYAEYSVREKKEGEKCRFSIIVCKRRVHNTTHNTND